MSAVYLMSNCCKKKKRILASTTNDSVKKAIDTVGTSNICTSEAAVHRYSAKQMFLKIW